MELNKWFIIHKPKVDIAKQRDSLSSRLLTSPVPA
jgi:hypothetical protein